MVARKNIFKSKNDRLVFYERLSKIIETVPDIFPKIETTSPGCFHQYERNSLSSTIESLRHRLKTLFNLKRLYRKLLIEP